MRLLFLRITSAVVLVGSFILIFPHLGTWRMFEGLFGTRLVVALQAALICVLGWIIVLEGTPVLVRWLPGATGRFLFACQNFWSGFKDGLFIKDANDLAENVREHMRNFRTFLWISLFCFLGAMISFIVLQFAGDSWYRIPGRLMFIFLASLLPSFWIFLKAQGCLFRISALQNYMSSQEVIQAIVGTTMESGRLAKLIWRKIFPHLLSKV